MVVIAKKFLRSVVSLTGARRKFSSHEIALASSFIKYTTVNLSNNSNQICLPRCLSTVSYESTDSQSNANTLREDLKKSRDRVAELVHAVPDKENLIDELTNLLSEIIEEKINAQEKQIKSLQEDLESVKAEYFFYSDLSGVRINIEIYLRENGLTDYNPSEDEQKILSRICDAKEREIKIDEFKWLFLLSPSNPHFDRHENQGLLHVLEKKKISVEEACRAFADINQHFANYPWESWDDDFCFHYSEYDAVFEKVKAYRNILECLSEGKSYKYEKLEMTNTDTPEKNELDHKSESS